MPYQESIDRKYDRQLHRPLQTIGYFLNPWFHYDTERYSDHQEEYKSVSDCTKMVPNDTVGSKIVRELFKYRDDEGEFESKHAIKT